MPVFFGEIMKSIMEFAEDQQQKAWQILEKLKIFQLWKSHRIEPHLVGSLASGLLMKHRDIDLHLYSDQPEPQNDFAIMGKLAEIRGIRKIEYTNLLNCEDGCLEWHAWYVDEDGEEWQLDMIHIRRGSRFDGYFEKQAQRIKEVMTPAQKESILRLKNECPEPLKIAGIEYYLAVIRDGINTWEEFADWRQKHPIHGIVEWTP